MKDIQKVKKGITHAGRFHTDDVLSTVLLLEFNPNLEIERVSEYVADDSNEEEEEEEISGEPEDEEFVEEYVEDPMPDDMPDLEEDYDYFFQTGSVLHQYEHIR
jgi:hypothetical protein